MQSLLAEPEIVSRLFDHIDNGTTDLSAGSWLEPVNNYLSPDRFEAELRVMRRTATPFCASAMVPNAGSYLARNAARIPVLVVRGADGVVRAFRNACRHRGAEVACGMGQQKAFVCPYHAWSYGLDGALQGVPHETGFPDLDKAVRGLAPLKAEERGGLIFVTQEPSAAGAAPVTVTPEIFGPGYELVSAVERETQANWKICAEGFLEGYHIYATHRDTFFPAQYDNVAVVEPFGCNSRVAFPYRVIERLRAFPEQARRADGKLTFVYHMFPNVMIATLPKRILMVVLEPLSVGVTLYHRYTLATAHDLKTDPATIDKGIEFGLAGESEDRAIVESIQRSLGGKGNEVFEFGLFEGAIAHFHHNLDAAFGEQP
jgi:phenylpropionate dioxygenase-like ring-hydroxylating dioxygenase large terminal subunit